MPINPFIELFESWKDNNELTIKDLRLKTVTLMALAFMARPSDLAPRAAHFEPSGNYDVPFSFSRDNVVFHTDKSMSVNFFGIKNDTNRSDSKSEFQLLPMTK
ncbi:hypothetical protein SNE40_005416 [Patella caerulea]|uniref:Uncharacterized protein n=1 Tax=Patella caerulea TaxID=87958 RepID=A0AAN8K7S5_PATCE